MTSTRTDSDPAVASPGRLPSFVLAIPLLISVGLVLAAMALRGGYGVLVALAGLAAVGVYTGLKNPVLASVYLLIATFFRLAIPSDTFPVDPFLPAFAGVVLSTLLWARGRTGRPSALTALEIALALYVAWNVLSALAPHAYEAGAPLDTSGFSVPRFVLIGVVMPLAMFLVGRRIFTDGRAIRVLIWTLVAAGAYSAMVSIAGIHGPSWLVWPPYILSNPNWPGRAVGVFGQPVVNGLVLIVGFLLATLVASHRSERFAARLLASAVAVVSVYAIYLTLTRGVWLAFGVVLVGGALFARGHRTWYVATIALVTSAIAVQWGTFLSPDRAAGGVGSASEVQDRLNTLATSLWAVGEEPVTGWGIGRFAAVNTYHHRQWSPTVPWERGYGIPSHLDLLGILVELGVVGLALWIAVLVLIVRQLVRTYRTVPATGLTERPLVLTAMLALAALVTIGLTVDLRFFDFPNIAVMMLVGAAVSRGGDTLGRGRVGPLPVVRARVRPLAPAPERPTRRSDVLVLAPVLALSLALVAAPAAVRVLGGSPSAVAPASVDLAATPAPGPTPRVGTLVQSRVLGTGDIRVRQWVRTETPVSAVSLVVPRLRFTTAAPTASQVLVTGAEGGSTGPDVVGTTPETFAFPGPTRRIYAEYVLRGVLDRRSTVPGRALAQILYLPVSSGARQGRTVVAVRAPEILTLACTAPSETPRPCGAPDGRRWRVELSGPDREDVVTAQVNLR